MNLIGFLPILVYGKNIRERKAGIKYFIIQAIGSRFLIFRRLVPFNATFSLEILGIVHLKYFCGGVLFLVRGLFMKIGIFPFHIWFPGAISGLSWPLEYCLLLDRN